MSFLSRLIDTILGFFGKSRKKETKEVKEPQEEVAVEEKIELKEEVEVLSEIDILKKDLSDAFEKLSSMDEYWEAIIAIEAVATSCASSDRDFSERERKEIEIFMQNIIQNREIPASVQEKIDEVYANPLPLNQAFLLAKETKIEMSVFEEILEVVMHTDGVKFEEKVVFNAWHDFKQSA